MVEVAIGIGYELTNTPRAEGPGQEGGTTVKDEEAEGDKKVRAVREVSEGGQAGHEERERRRASREERGSPFCSSAGLMTKLPLPRKDHRDPSLIRRGRYFAV